MEIKDLKIQLFADGADLEGIREMNKLAHIKGFTTNPTLMKKAGVKDYSEFAKTVLKEIDSKPISFEVFADDFETMYSQAKEIATWGDNVYVKIPIMNTKKEYSYELIKTLSDEGVKLNVTAIFTLDQVKNVTVAMENSPGGVVSVFAGRVADTGMDPIPLMKDCLSVMKKNLKLELLWASPRELLNVIQANDCGCHIITATPDILKKLSNLGKDLETFSRETVQMFYDDAQAAGYTI